MGKYFINPQDEGDLEEVVRSNMETACSLRKELRILEIANRNLVNTDDTSMLERPKETDEKDLGMEEEEEYLYYYTNLVNDFFGFTNSCNELQIVINNLPVIENKNYWNIINRIKLEILKEIYEFEELKVGEEFEFIEEVTREQNLRKNLLHWINYVIIQKTETMTNHVDAVHNRLIFLKTDLESIYIERDLYGNNGYFESFKELLNSIEDGTFKNVKQFVSNSRLRGISEVKGFKTRILFERVTADTYIILGAFIKKSDRAKDYINSLVNRVEVYRAIKSSILLKLNYPEYLEENRLIRDHLMDSLTNKKLMKTRKKGSVS